MENLKIWIINYKNAITFDPDEIIKSELICYYIPITIMHIIWTLLTFIPYFFIPLDYRLQTQHILIFLTGCMTLIASIIYIRSTYYICVNIGKQYKIIKTLLIAILI